MFGGRYTAKKPEHGKPKRRRSEDVWYAPKIEDVYAQFEIAQTMLNRIPDAELAFVKREMGIVEEMLWQFCHQLQGDYINGKAVLEGRIPVSQNT